MKLKKALLWQPRWFYQRVILIAGAIRVTAISYLGFGVQRKEKRVRPMSLSKFIRIHICVDSFTLRIL